MEVVVSLEQRFHRTPDGVVWTDGQFPYEFWRRYLQVFDQVLILARVRDVASPARGARQVDGEQVRLAAIPYYIGPGQFILRYPEARRVVEKVAARDSAFILRVPSAIGAILAKACLRRNRAYGVEVVGDPWDVFAPGANAHFLRPFFRRLFARRLRTLCSHASAAAYVTAAALQRRYPAPGARFSTHYSSVELPPEAFRHPATHGRALSVTKARVVTVGSLQQRYKGIDVLIEAVALCWQKGLQLELTVVGDGQHRAELEKQALDVGLGDSVRFIGQLSGSAAVREQLDEADLFVLASRTEGLPRVIIEAMARGLQCIGSRVGGIPELLEDEEMVDSDDAAGLAQKIFDVISDPDRMRRMGERNFEKAQEYSDERLMARRVEFYRRVLECYVGPTVASHATSNEAFCSETHT